MSETPLTDGAAPKALRKRKLSEPTPAPSEPPSMKSSTQHKRAQTSAQPPTNEAEKVAQVKALFRGEQPTDNSPTMGEDQIGGDLDPSADTAASASTQPQSLSAADLEGDGVPPVSGEEGERAGSGFSIKELAEELGTTPKKLYDSLEITTQEGETLTLGQVKDRIQGQLTAEREIAQKEQSIMQREAALLQNQQLFQSLYSDLERNLSPQTVNQLKEQQQRQQQRETALLMNAMPELRDEANFDRFRRDVVEFAGSYGFKPHELAISDHRIAVMLRDAMQTKKRLDKLLSFDPEKDKAPPKSARPQGKQSKPSRVQQAIRSARANGAKDSDKLNAVSALLNRGRR